MKPTPKVARRDTVELARLAAKRPRRSATHLSRTLPVLLQDKDIDEALDYVLENGAICQKILEQGMARQDAFTARTRR